MNKMYGHKGIFYKKAKHLLWDPHDLVELSEDRKL